MATGDSGLRLGLNLYRPMMFVGLGGTGCAIGIELERRLRQALCGPDGTAFAERMGMGGYSPYLPYQLPGCVQFVYADLNEDELDQIHTAGVPVPEHARAAAVTSHLARGVVPRLRSYREVAGHLRLTAAGYVEPWLPPPGDDEPRVAPITRGAGQLPTVGRAALFEAVRTDVEPAQRPLRDALDALSRSTAELHVLGGSGSGSTCDVFVAFSVAGGTGAGIFYDYLHLIADVFDRAGLRAQIYPLVLMPSAFEEGRSGGRPARLNAGRALPDLFRLVDDQNARKSDVVLGFSDALRRPVDVAYPDRRIQIAPGTVQTGILFSRVPGMDREDLHQSIASLVLTLTTVERPPNGLTSSGQVFQSFADSFMNAAVERASLADSGIGHRGVSTALVASLTVPSDELADLMAGRLLARAVPQLDAPPADGTEQNIPLIGRLARMANLAGIIDRPELPVSAPRTVDGAVAIRRSLTDYAESIASTLRALNLQLEQQVTELAAQQFQPFAAVNALLDSDGSESVDIFRLQRVIRGHPDLIHPAERTGLLGLMQARSGLPAQPPNRPSVSTAAPLLPEIRDRVFTRAKWGDPSVQLALSVLSDWHRWNTWRLWHEAWSRQSRVWQPKLDAVVGTVDAFAEALREFAGVEPEEFERRAVTLYRNRTGSRQLLPTGGDLDAFYYEVLRRLRRRGLAEGAGEAVVLQVLLRQQDWRRAFEEVAERNAPRRAIAHLRLRLTQEIKTLFAESVGGVPMLPTMDRLLARSVSAEAPDVDPLELRAFNNQLLALLPGGFNPQGAGLLKVLVVHPEVAGLPSSDVEAYLRRTLALPADRGVFEFRPGPADSITVVLFRTSMAIDEVGEARELMRFWAMAAQENDPADLLRWRQRLGYDAGWSAMTEDDRQRVLHWLMCAMWNGQVTVEGPAASPRAVTVRLDDHDDVAPAMHLQLRRLGETSSWGYLLPAYETWALEDGDSARRQFVARLGRTLPRGLTDDPEPPSAVYRAFIDVAATEVARLERVRERLPPEGRGYVDRLLAFWTTTFPEAETQLFQVPDIYAVRANLHDLDAYCREPEDQPSTASGTGLVDRTAAPAVLRLRRPDGEWADWAVDWLPEDTEAGGFRIWRGEYQGTPVVLRYAVTDRAEASLENAVATGLRMLRRFEADQWFPWERPGRSYPPELSRLLGYDLADDRPFMVTAEAGEPVSSLARPLTPDQVRDFASSLARGLYLLEGLGIVHGRLSDVTVHWDPRSRKTQINGYEIARRPGDPRARVTSPWTSPEERQGTGYSDPRDDVYATARVILRAAGGPDLDLDLEHRSLPDPTAIGVPWLSHVLAHAFGPAERRPNALELLRRLGRADSLPLDGAA